MYDSAAPGAGPRSMVLGDHTILSLIYGDGDGTQQRGSGPAACLASIDDPMDDPLVVLWTQDVAKSKY